MVTLDLSVEMPIFCLQKKKISKKTKREEIFINKLIQFSRHLITHLKPNSQLQISKIWQLRYYNNAFFTGV